MKNFWNCLHENFNFLPKALLLSLAILLGVVGCQKDPNSIGLNLKDRDDLLNAILTDTVSINAYSVFEDTLNTRNLLSNFLGFIRDPVFGTTSTGIYAQLVPEGNSVNFGNSPTLDSVVLTLRYAGGYYGDTLNPFSVQVYRLTENISSSDKYFQNTVLAHSSENLTYEYDFHLYPKPKSKVRLDTIVEAHARIRLSDELGSLLLRSASQMSSNESFKNFLKGLYICAKPLANDGSLVNFNLVGALSGIRLYYKNNNTASQFQFYIKSNETVRISYYEHDYQTGNPLFIDQVVHKDTLLGKEQLYVQSMGGVKTKIAFPHIKAFKDMNVIVNKAELVISNIGEDLILFPPPPRLNIQGVNKKGELVVLPDANTTYWGGSYNATTKEYRFRITRYIQNIILHDNYEPFVYLVADRAAADAYRLILSGTHPNQASSRLRIEVFYTEY